MFDSNKMNTLVDISLDGTTSFSFVYGFRCEFEWRNNQIVRSKKDRKIHNIEVPRRVFGLRKRNEKWEMLRFYF